MPRTIQTSRRVTKLMGRKEMSAPGHPAGLLPPAEQDPPGGPGQGRPAVHGAEGDDQPQRERPDQGHEKQLQGYKKPLVQGYQYRLGHW